MLFERYLSTLVRPKKHLGQHFLRDLSIAERTAEAVQFRNSILEIGPGTGVLTRYLLQHTNDLRAVELDVESVDYLLGEGLLNQSQIIQADFLRLKLEPLFDKEFALVGNFPYNISSQILFKVLENKPSIPECVGMFQKEVAERVCSEPGSKAFGIMSVLCQTYYRCSYLFTVEPESFFPPPRVKSAVIRLERIENLELPCTEKALFRVVKLAFNQRRKMLSNSLKSLGFELPEDLKDLRPEQLQVSDFWRLANLAS